MTAEEIKKDWEVIEAFRLYLNQETDNGDKCFDFASSSLRRWPEALREVERLQDVLMYISYMSPDEAEMFAAKHAKEVLKEILK